jgi:hypothetical protein
VVIHLVLERPFQRWIGTRIASPRVAPRVDPVLRPS